MNNACKNLGIDAKIACHGLRKTWGYHAWSNQKVSPVIIMDVYNHTNYKVTKRYLGIAQDDLDEAYLKMDFFHE
jgi:integrase